MTNSNVIGTAVVRLEVDKTKFNRELASAKTQMDTGKGGSDNYNRGLKDIQRESDAVGTKVKGAGSQIDAQVGAFARAELGIRGITSGLGELSQKLSKPIQDASNLGESINAVNVVFGESAVKLHDFAKNSAESVGLSERAFNQLATPLGAMLKGTGMSMDEVADKTIELTKRASDMASVYNVDVEEAMTAISAALRGEMEPIRKFGVTLDQNSIEAKAFSMGLTKNAVDMVSVQGATIDLEKAQANLLEVQKQGTVANKGTPAQLKAISDQQGDTSKAVDAAALAYENLQRAQRGGGGNVAAAQTTYAKALATANKEREKLSDLQGKSKIGQKGEASTALEVADAQQSVAEAEKKLAAAKTGKVGELSLEAKGQAALALVMEKSKDVEGDFGNTKEGLANQQKILTAEMEKFRAEMGGQMVPVMLTAIQTVRGLPPELQMVTFGLMEFGPAIAKTMGGLALIGPAIGPAITAMRNFSIASKLAFLAPPVGIVVLLVAVAVALYVFRDKWIGIIGPLVDFMLGWAKGIKDAVFGAVNAVLGFVRDNWSKIALMISGPFLPLVLLATDGFGIRSALIGAFTAVLDFLGGLYGSITGIFSNAAMWLYNTGKNILLGLWNGMKEIWRDVEGWIKNIPNAIPDWFAKTLGMKSPSKVMKIAGENTIKGLQIGLATEFKTSVLPQLKQMTAQVESFKTKWSRFAPGDPANEGYAPDPNMSGKATRRWNGYKYIQIPGGEAVPVDANGRAIGDYVRASDIASGKYTPYTGNNGGSSGRSGGGQSSAIGSSGMFGVAAHKADWFSPESDGMSIATGAGAGGGGQSGQLGVTVMMPYATINARDKVDAERSTQDMAWAAAAGMRARGGMR